MQLVGDVARDGAAEGMGDRRCNKLMSRDDGSTTRDASHGKHINGTMRA
jgi:hypothetical protein